MRVVSGIARGVRLQSVPGDTTRPILDRVKTALFDVIRLQIQGTKILDLFAGSGSVGIEALSQGASQCTFIDLAPKAIETIETNLKATKLLVKAMVKKVDAFSFLKRSSESFDLVYVAPPQYKNIWIESMHCLAERPELLNKDGVVIVQIDPKEYETLDLSCFREEQVRTYGKYFIGLLPKNLNHRDKETKRN